MYLPLLTVVASALLQLSAASPADSVVMDARVTAEQIEREARRHLGKRYRYGSNGPETFDCTGLTRYVYAKAGYQLSRSARDQAHDGRPVKSAFSGLQKGDILIFGSRRDKRVPGHAGIFLDADSTGTNFRFIHACRRGVIVSEFRESYYVDRLLGVRRILPDFPSSGPERGDTLVPPAGLLPLDALLRLEYDPHHLEKP